MSTTVEISLKPNPSVDINEDFNGSTIPLPGAPVHVRIIVPESLIEMAHTYPTIDWNEVMRYAVRHTPQGGGK